MSTAIASGLLALLGALGGVWLGNWLQARHTTNAARRARFEAAARAVSVAIVARNFATSVGGAGRPASVTDDELAEFQREYYFVGLKRMTSTLGAAREAVVALKHDGFDVPAWVEDEPEFHTRMPELEARLADWLRLH